MIRPRWQGLPRSPHQQAWHRWDRGVALIAVRTAWVVFDITYIPLRNFWLQRNLYPIQHCTGGALAWLPDITVLRPDQGIEPHRTTVCTSNSSTPWIRP